MLFDVKSDLRRKARLVVGGHKVDVSAGDVRNPYLNAYTRENV